jgi:hypothetical protein
MTLLLLCTFCTKLHEARTQQRLLPLLVSMNRIMGEFLVRGKTSQQTVQNLMEKQLVRDAAAAVTARAEIIGRTAAKAAARDLLTEDAAGRRARAVAGAQAAMAAAGNILAAAADDGDDDEDSSSNSSSSSSSGGGTSDGGSAPPLNKKKKQKHHAAQLPWVLRAVAIFMFLHPHLYNGDAKATAAAIGIDRTTLISWVSTTSKRGQSYVMKWFDMVSDMTWAAARAQFKGFSDAFGKKFDHVPDDSKLSDRVLAKFKSARGQGPKVLSIFTSDITGAAKGRLARQRPHEYISLTRKKKHLVSSGDKGRRAARRFKDVQHRWSSGDPISKQEMKIQLHAKFGRKEQATGGAGGGGDYYYSSTQVLLLLTWRSKKHVTFCVERGVRRVTFSMRLSTWLSKKMLHLC